MSTCRSCQAEVIFVPSAQTGKPMILDAKPARGVVCYMEDADGVQLLATAKDWDPDDLERFPPKARVVDVYTDHHATCPAAAEWKGKHREAAR